MSIFNFWSRVYRLRDTAFGMHALRANKLLRPVFLLNCAMLVLCALPFSSLYAAQQHTQAQSLTLPPDVYAEKRQHFLTLEEKLRTYSRRRINDFDGEI